MKNETLEQLKKDDLYKHLAAPFISDLIRLGIPLTAINTNDWHCTTAPRIYVTREYGRSKGGQSRKAHVNQLGHKAARRLAEFYTN